MNNTWHDRVRFGLHYDLHATAHDTILGRDVTPEMLRAAWDPIAPDWIQCDCKGHPGYTSWPTRTGAASPGIVKDALRIHRDVTRALGLPLVMHYSGIWDTAAVTEHPEWARVNLDGSVDADHACPRRGYTEARMIPQLLELIDTYDVDGFWVDGENWACRPCFCDICAREFERESGTPPPRTAAQPTWTAWLAFQRQGFVAHVRKYTEAVKARKPSCAVCSNWMYSVRQPEPVDAPVDYLSGDFTASWGVDRAAAEARFMDGRGLPWDLMAWGFLGSEDPPNRGGWTTKTAVHLQQEAAEVIANGGAVQIYNYLERGGRLASWEHAIFADVSAFCRARADVAKDTTSVPQVAVLHSETHYYAHNQPLFMPGEATEPMEGALHAFLDSGYHIDLVNEATLRKRIGEYAVVVVAEQDPIAADLPGVFDAYVRAGGRLMVSGPHVASTLGDLCGVAPVASQIDDFRRITVGSESLTVRGPWQPVELRGARTWTDLLDGRDPKHERSGYPAVTLRALGAGSVAAIHGAFFASYLRRRYPQARALIRTLTREMWPDPAVEVEAPGALALTLRRRGGSLIVHLCNRGADPPTSPRNPMVERVPDLYPVTVRVRTKRRPSGVRAVPAADAPEPAWAWEGGVATVHGLRLGVHLAVVLEGASG